MITVNTREHPWLAGMSIQTIIEEKKYTFRHLVVKLNDTFIPEERYASTLVQDGDDVMVIHLMAGG